MTYISWPNEFLKYFRLEKIKVSDMLAAKRRMCVRVHRILGAAYERRAPILSVRCLKLSTQMVNMYPFTAVWTSFLMDGLFKILKKNIEKKK